MTDRICQLSHTDLSLDKFFNLYFIMQDSPVSIPVNNGRKQLLDQSNLLHHSLIVPKKVFFYHLITLAVADSTHTQMNFFVCRGEWISFYPNPSGLKIFLPLHRLKQNSLRPLAQAKSGFVGYCRKQKKRSSPTWKTKIERMHFSS